jgi:hypothetical protein
VARPPQTVLVAGSYPPALSAAADATVAAARRELAAGHAVITVAPRASGASRTTALGGPGTARRLDLLRRATGAERLVLSLEPGIPLLPPPGSPILRPLWPVVDAVTLALLARRLRRFHHVTLLVSSPEPDPTDPTDLTDLTGSTGSTGPIRRLAPRAHEIVVSGPAATPDVVSALTAAAQGVPITAVDAPALGPAYRGISAAGPPEPAIVRIRGRGAQAGRRMLGPLYTPLRLLAWPLERLVPAARRRWHSMRGI